MRRVHALSGSESRQLMLVHHGYQQQQRGGGGSGKVLHPRVSHIRNLFNVPKVVVCPRVTVSGWSGSAAA